ncbi:dialkylresorcinol condensing enzyme DarA [Aquimarina muelleri]|uniref:dialkylrecorsinol condensing enzyme DarA n=1 Tax=Aquimarina muelleri TaxID=279356 RepID=UPI003F685D4A
MKEVLVVYYSQTGQLFDIVSNIASAMKDKDINITYLEIVPKNAYKFPWKKDAFFDVFPESFLQIPIPLKESDPEIFNKKYDLIILGYQVWYLSPSIPINSFLKSENAKKLLNNTPVITVIGCRNMWIQAQEKVKNLLISCNAKLVGNIALVDRHINHISVLTITHWMFKGKKDRFLGFFPKPGVSDKDINNVVVFVPSVKEALRKNNFMDLQKKIVKLGAVKIKPFLILADKRANLLFSKWANLIYKKGEAGNPKRKKALILFNYYLLFAIWVIAPIVFIVFLVTYIFMYKKIIREKKYYSSVDTKNN